MLRIDRRRGRGILIARDRAANYQWSPHESVLNGCAKCKIMPGAFTERGLSDRIESTRSLAPRETSNCVRDSFFFSLPIFFRLNVTRSG